MRLSKALKMCIWAIWVLLFSAGSVGLASSVQIAVKSTPELGTTNRLTNADLNNVSDTDIPLNWRFTTARPDLLQGKLSHEAYRGDRSLLVEAASGEVSGYWVQSEIPVESGESLLFSSLVQLHRGTALMYVIGYDTSTNPRRQVYSDRRLFLRAAQSNPLYPVFVKAELLKGLVSPEWARRRIHFYNSDDVDIVTVNLGLYFSGSRGRVWFEQMYLGEPWVDLSVEVMAGSELDAFQQIQVIDDMGELVYDSGVFPQPTTSWAERLRVAADVDHYTITVIDVDGNQTRKRYPN